MTFKPILGSLWAVAAATIWIVTPGQASEFHMLYHFCGGTSCTDGERPQAGVILDNAGNLYGTTLYGGDTSCLSGYGCGAVFELSPSGSETVLHAFDGTDDGEMPSTALIRDAKGNLFGTTGYGPPDNDCGAVFELAAGGSLSELYSFQGGADGCKPSGPLIEDSSGNLYGETGSGGGSTGCDGNGCGTVFKIAADGTESVLYAFPGDSTSGEGPNGGLAMDSAGNLYGTTYGGPAGFYRAGTVFEVSSGGTQTMLHEFSPPTDGYTPLAGVVRDQSGNLFGTTEFGGQYGLGTVFKVASDGKEKVLYSFQGVKKHDGSNPAGGLLEDKQGNLYGTTTGGGIRSSCKTGCGIVFKLNPKGAETVLHDFILKEGEQPLGALVADSRGNLYGTLSLHYGGVFEVKK